MAMVNLWNLPETAAKMVKVIQRFFLYFSPYLRITVFKDFLSVKLNISLLQRSFCLVLIRYTMISKIHHYLAINFVRQ